MKWGDFYLSNLYEVLPFRLLSDKAAVKRELRCESEGDRMSLPLIQYQPYLYMPYFTTASVLHQRISFKSKAKKQKTVKCLL